VRGQDPELQLDVGEGEAVAVGEHRVAGDPAPVDVGPVQRPEVLDAEELPVRPHPGVPAAHPRTRQDHVAVVLATDHDLQVDDRQRTVRRSRQSRDEQDADRAGACRRLPLVPDPLVHARPLAAAEALPPSPTAATAADSSSASTDVLVKDDSVTLLPLGCDA
jgi:hypothetical protein